ncbi:unnamed protein product [Vitrella brassicaformis CCMP3155]|uniref:Uncharacterized protein n=2 Tax=Vitrella brassicaformis TaxID=1169539 RepID=A0A0G4ERI6_VITBC|nr:unnamed protein product [Vitrella brassicaformis CCMP3155]|eukprot:CEM00644.1 unnamed protein product [Vitrella brassicaformis CCMP3155]
MARPPALLLLVSLASFGAVRPTAAAGCLSPRRAPIPASLFEELRSLLDERVLPKGSESEAFDEAADACCDAHWECYSAEGQGKLDCDRGFYKCFRGANEDNLPEAAVPFVRKIALPAVLSAALSPMGDLAFEAAQTNDTHVQDLYDAMLSLEKKKDDGSSSSQPLIRRVALIASLSANNLELANVTLSAGGQLPSDAFLGDTRFIPALTGLLQGSFQRTSPGEFGAVVILDDEVFLCAEMSDDPTDSCFHLSINVTTPNRFSYPLFAPTSCEGEKDGTTCQAPRGPENTNGCGTVEVLAFTQATLEKLLSDEGVALSNQCCNQHDICYTICGASQSECDLVLKECLLNVNLFDPSPAMPFVAFTFYEVLKLFGGPAYGDGQDIGCLECRDGVCEGVPSPQVSRAPIDAAEKSQLLAEVTAALQKSYVRLYGDKEGTSMKLASVELLMQAMAR